ncbi:MAG: hypothetical protein ACT7A5_31360 [Ferrovibrionaceae bacterium]
MRRIAAIPLAVAAVLANGPAAALSPFLEQTPYQRLALLPGEYRGAPTLVDLATLRFFAIDTFGSQAPNGRLANLYPDLRNNTALFLDRRFSLQLMTRLGQVESPAPGSSTAFAGTGGYIEHLFARYQDDTVTAFAGKFDPFVGIAWDRAPILFGQDFNAAYRLKEKIGLGGGLAATSALFGRVSFEASAFMADSTLLSQSVFTAPAFGDPRAKRLGHNRLDYGGVSNTGRLGSWAASLTGGHVPDLPGLSWMVSAEFQQAGQNNPRDESGWIVSLAQEFRLADDLRVTPLVEYAAFRGYHGNDQDVAFLTAMLETRIGRQWIVNLAMTPRTIENLGNAGGTSRDQLFTAGIVHVFDFGLELGAGFKRQRVAGDWSNAVGAAVNWRIRF